MAARTISCTGSRCISVLCLLAVLCVAVASSHREQFRKVQQDVEISYFPNAQHNFGYLGKFSDPNTQQHALDILQLNQEKLGSVDGYSADVAQYWKNAFRQGLPNFRERRAVTQEITNQTVTENVSGVLINFSTKFSNLGNREFSMETVSAHPEMFELSSNGLLQLKSGYNLDYEDSTMRSIVFQVNATNPSDPSEVTQITATLIVTNVDEAPVFTTEPKPYLATVRSNTGAGYTIMELEAVDPENEVVQYEKTSVSPGQYNNRIELRTIQRNGKPVCQLLTFGTGNFLPEGSTITITVSARDASSGGQVTSVPVSVLIGVRPPQFYQTSYEGAMEEKNQPQQTVYSLGTTEELQVRWKTFQPGPVTLSLTSESSTDPLLFDINSDGSIVCLQTLDYESISPKTQALTVTATQRVGIADLTNNVTVRVTVLDKNDNRPIFDQSQYLVPAIKENAAVGTSIYTVTARDADTGVAGQIDYSVLDTDDFDIVTEEEVSEGVTVYSGRIRVHRRLDYDVPDGTYTFFKVQAKDRGNPSLSSTANVRVTIINVNDEVPQFTTPSGETYPVMEDALVGQFITQVLATDKDGDNIFYSIDSSQPENKFQINRETGVLTLARLIDDNDDLFTLDIKAEDDGSCCTATEGPSSNSNVTQIYVQVYGVNKNKPDFRDCATYTPAVDEHSPFGTLVQIVKAYDDDRGPNGVVTYSIESPKTGFKIGSSAGNITVDSDLDREAFGFVQMTVKGRDGGEPPLEGWCTFRVAINDINDHAPSFDKDRYQANITTELQTYVSFLAVRAYDDDVGDNAKIVYTLVYDAEGKFGIIPENGFIFLKERLTQPGSSYSLTAMAMDAGNPPLNSTVEIVVNVKDAITNPPAWDKDYNLLTYVVNETVPDGYLIIQNMVCNSNIANPRVEFQLVNEEGKPASFTRFFKLQSSPGSNRVNVLATGNFDYRVKQEHIVRIRCLNFGPVTLLTEVNPKVELVDTNNQIPQFEGLSEDGRYIAQIQENQPAGSSVMTVQASDLDATDAYNTIAFSIIEGQQNFSIEPGSTKNTAIIKTRLEFDRESKSLYFITVKASDEFQSSIQNVNGPNTATVNVRVTITDVNDNPPEFPQTLYHLEVPENYYINEPILPAIVVDDKDDSDRGRHTYRIISGNGPPLTFGVRNRLGNLFLLRNLDYEGNDKNFNLVLEASDGKFSATTTVTVTVLDVNDNSPVFNPDSYTVDWIVENDPNVPLQLLSLTATDDDVDRPNNITYSLEGSSFNVPRYFTIGVTSGNLTLIRPLDRDPPDGSPNYQFTVVAADENDNPNYGYATVSVQPQDVNDNKPEFVTDPLEASVPEHSADGTSVVLISATDRDYRENGTVTYFIDDIVDGANVPRPGYFTINENNGLVRTNTDPVNLDRESEDTYRLTIRLQDGGSPPLTTVGVLTVTLSDINDQPPICQQKIYTTQMSENQQTGEVIRVVATDADIGENAKISYVLGGTNGTRFFSVTTIDNEGSVQVGNPVDYEDENQRFFNLTVKAQDNAGHEDTCYVEIEVLDFNDNAPEIKPKSNTTSVLEDAPIGTYLATFSATDKDSGINKEFEFSISRSSDPRRHFSIGPQTGVVTIRRRLDRETVDLHVLTIQAIDKGSPPQTGTATLSVIVEDVNDNYPTFKEDYHPHVLEGEGEGVERVVQEILAKDPDAAPYGPPFGFQLGTCSGDNCANFQFQFNPERDGGNGTATISTNKMFDREQQKYYYLPIIMWDMRGSNDPRAMTGTNTLTVTIADINDNEMGPGTQNMFVYNYKGSFGPIEIGRVYVEDKDDWDLPDKTFTFNSPEWMKQYFSVNEDTGMVTMKKGVPSTTGQSPYRFTVNVYDRKFQNTVVSTVFVTVEDLSEEAVRNSGAVRLKDTSAEEFIKVPPSSNSNNNPKSMYTEFRELMAQKLNTDVQNVQIISVQDTADGFTDVRYSVHGSPYYPSSQTDSIVVLNKGEFENLGLDISEVPIDACAEEVFEGGCYNYMNITGKPAIVNSNGTSFVGVEVFIVAREGCRAEDFPEPNECSGDYCYHGGVCVQDDFGVLSCQNCSEGFEGPRCQQLSHSFDGKSYAMYPTLEQCENSETSIEFITTQPDGLLFYNGPMTPPTEDQPQDFIALALYGGLPVLTIDHGSGATTLSVDGTDSQGNTVISSLADGKWHKIDIVRTGKNVEMIVDDCRAAGPSGSETTPPDTKPCHASGSTVGGNSFLNVASLLQVGGRAPGHTFPSSNVVSNTGFDGCVRNLVHNSMLYDLHYKDTGSVPSGENGCPREDAICGNKCVPNGICTASFQPPQATCLCKPGWRGDTCSVETTVRDLRSNSYIQWQLRSGVSLPSYELELQVMYRTWDENGVLFTASSQDNSQRVTMELMDGRLRVLYNQDSTLLLNNTQASDGQWHVAKFKRVLNLAILTLDAGEGRNFVSHRSNPVDNVYMTIGSNSPLFAGATVTQPSGAEVIDRDLTDTCIQDIRINNQWLPMQNSENSASVVAAYVKEQNVRDGCTRANGCVPPPPCPPNTVCHDLWGRHVCRCAPGYYADDTGVCISLCTPNPCFQDMQCQVDAASGQVVCDCDPIKPWYGQFCNLYPRDEGEGEPAVGVASATIAAIVVSIVVVLVLLLVAICLVMHYQRKKRSDDSDSKFVVEDDADFDIRENVMYYDEEGAGEEDHQAYDLSKLPNTASETMMAPTDMPSRMAELPRGRRIPDDRPDVGDVLHDRLDDADRDPDAPPYDTLTPFADEGAGSEAGSLSSLGSSSSDASQDYDYLNDWGPKFAKLADMYGAGGE